MYAHKKKKSRLGVRGGVWGSLQQGLLTLRGLETPALNSRCHYPGFASYLDQETSTCCTNIKQGRSKGESRNIERGGGGGGGGGLERGSGGSVPGKILSIEFLVSILFFTPLNGKLQF